jgi:O-acetylserine/cysteine efflux transporter
VPPIDILLTLLAVIIWSLNVIAVKIGLIELPPLLMTALRFAMVGLLAAPFTRITRAQLPWILLLSFTFGTLHFALLFVGLNMTEAGTGAILAQLGTPFATLLAVTVLGERMTRAQAVGLIVSFAGAAVLSAGPSLPSWQPLLILTASALAWAVSNIIVKKSPGIGPLPMVAWVSLFSVPQIALLSLIFENGQWAAMQSASLTTWMMVTYTALGSSLVAYTIWYRLLARHPVSRVMPYSLLTPLLGVVFGVLLLGDGIGLHKVVGGIMVIGGVAVSSLRWPGMKTRA